MEHVALMVKLRYEGDFSITLRGLQINLDTIGSNAPDEADANLAMPFFCPFEMTLKDVVLDGVASIEVFQEYTEVPPDPLTPSGVGASIDPTTSRRLYDGGEDYYPPIAPLRPFIPSSTASLATTREVSRCPSTGGPRRVRSTATFNTSTPSGYGVLLGAGGRRAMRPPSAPRQGLPNGTASPDTPSPFALSGKDPAAVQNNARGGSSTLPASAPSRGCSIADVLQHRVTPAARTVKVQLFGDPIKAFSVISNFESVPGANKKVEGTVRMLLKPAIERLMTDGITVSL